MSGTVHCRCCHAVSPALFTAVGLVGVLSSFARRGSGLDTGFENPVYTEECSYSGRGAGVAIPCLPICSRQYLSKLQVFCCSRFGLWLFRKQRKTVVDFVFSCVPHTHQDEYTHDEEMSTPWRNSSLLWLTIFVAELPRTSSTTHL